MSDCYNRQALVRCLFCLVLFVPFTSASQPSPDDLLQRMVEAFSQQNFQISMVANRGGDIEPLRLEHGIVEGESIYHLSYLDGPMRDIVKRGGEVSYFEYDSAPYSLRQRPLSGPFPNAFLHGMDEISESYEFVLAGRNRVSGRLAQMVRIIPKDPHRFGMAVWLDVQTGFMLQMDYVDRSGVSAEQIQVIHMNINREPSEQLLAIAEASMPEVIDRSEMLNKEDLKVRWSCDWLPPGFRSVVQDRHRLALTDDIVEYMMYGDGLVRFSVYINEIGDGRETATIMTKGATSFYSELRDGVEVAVIGRIPPETAKRIAANIHARPQPRAEAGTGHAG